MIWWWWGYLKASPWFEIFIFQLFWSLCLFPWIIYEVETSGQNRQKSKKKCNFLKKSHKIKNLHFCSKSHHSSLNLCLKTSNSEFYDCMSSFHHLMKFWKKLTKCFFWKIEKNKNWQKKKKSFLVFLCYITSHITIPPSPPPTHTLWVFWPFFLNRIHTNMGGEAG